MKENEERAKGSWKRHQAMTQVSRWWKENRKEGGWVKEPKTAVQF